MESMSLGKAILTFDVAFARELLGEGYPIPLAKNPKDYGKYLHLLCTSATLRTKAEAYLRSRARDNFDMKTVAKNYRALYMELLENT